MFCRLAQRYNISTVNNFSPFLKWRSVATLPPVVVPDYLRSSGLTRVSTLNNGMRVATENTHGEMATVGVWVDAGSVYEDDRTNGVAHFLEHMAFKGTKKRTQQGLEVEIENMGGALNAYTSREQIVFYVKAFKNDIPKAVDILADILQKSTFLEDQVEREKGTILREMEEVAGNIQETVFDHLHSVVYRDTSLGRTIIGPSDNVKAITRADLIKYVNTHYTGPRMVLASVGGVDHDQLVKLANSAFSGLSPKDNKPTDFKHPNKFRGGMVTIREDKMPEVQAAVAFESVGWSHPDYFVFLLLQAMLGTWDKTLGGSKNLSSKLSEAIALNELADSVSLFNTFYHNTGMFGFYVITPKADKIEAILHEVFSELQRLAFSVTEAEVERFKTKVLSDMMMQLDGTAQACEETGRQLLTIGRRVSPAEAYLRVKAITAADVKRVCRNHFYDVDPGISAMGPIERTPDYNKIRGWTAWSKI